MPTQLNYAKIASILINANPLSFKSYPDGSLVVIAPTGQKFTFTPDQVQSVSHSITPEPEPKSPPKPKPKPQPESKPGQDPAPKPTAKRGRPAKPKSE